MKETNAFHLAKALFKEENYDLVVLKLQPFYGDGTVPSDAPVKKQAAMLLCKAAISRGEVSLAKRMARILTTEYPGPDTDRLATKVKSRAMFGI